MRVSRNYFICLTLARPPTIIVITISSSHSLRRSLLTEQVGLLTRDADDSVYARENLLQTLARCLRRRYRRWEHRGSRIAGVQLFLFQTRPKYARHRGELNAQQDLDTDNVNRR